MTPLTKRVVRLTDTIWQGRRIVVVLDPADDSVEFRQKGLRKGYKITVLQGLFAATRIQLGIEKPRRGKR